jgi:hypothetical protein
MKTLTPPSPPARSKRQINRAIRHLGLEIQNNRDGYSYFTAIEGSALWPESAQIGESVYICWLSQVSVAWWVTAAHVAAEEGPR